MIIGKEWEFLASVGVDSGQLLLVDPCFIDGHWHNRPFQDVRRYQHKETGRILQYRVDFERFDIILPEFGKSMNDLAATDEWAKLDEPIPDSLDYESVCLTTLQQPEQGGQVAGLAAAFSTGHGDGEYPVYVKRRGGRIAQVLIDFGVEDDDE